MLIIFYNESDNRLILKNQRQKNGYQILEINCTQWIRIFHHHSTKLFDKNKERAKEQIFFINEGALFSVLGYIDEKFQIDGVFNFLFHFPNDYPEDYFYFNQSSNPFTSTTVSHFSNKVILDHCEYINKVECKFTGLAISTSEYTYLDANSHSAYYWFSIGQNANYQNKIGSIPGPPCNDENLGVSTTNLWMRILNNDMIRFLPFVDKCSIGRCNNINTMVFILPFVFVFIVL